jgi:hypothetical protein
MDKRMLANRSLMAPGIAIYRPLTKFRKRLFSISFEEATVARRGFSDGGIEATRRLEQIGRTFLQGYHAALDDEDQAMLVLSLDATEHSFRGFAYEGAAMGLAFLDQFSPWRRGRRLRGLLNGAGSRHTYMIHVGAGWAMARLPWLRWNVDGALTQLDPLLRWLALDGYGFHEGYFHWRRFLLKPERINKLQGYARHAFAQGLGRALWFIEGADVRRLPAAVALFPRPLHADLWSGIGLACTYAGGVERTAVEQLRVAAGAYTAELAQGAAFAAKTRQRAGNESLHTEMACQVLCGLSSEAAAQVTDVKLQLLPEDGDVPAYEIWRQRIQSHFI